MELSDALFVHCRAGFESDCAAELQDWAGRMQLAGFCRAKPQSGYVIFESAESGVAARLHREVPFRQLVFPRQWFVSVGFDGQLPVDDRVTPLAGILARAPCTAAGLFLETAATDEGKALSPLCRAIRRPLEQALRQAAMLTEQRCDCRLHVCFLSTHAAFAGYALADNSAPWPMGIVRLKFPREAPSRSTLKLEEAWLTLLTEQERADSLRPGVTAVDLGAAPGGWTWQLIRHGLYVTAVDNGRLADTLARNDNVVHRREDGFKFRPDTPVEWMVCDMVEQPSRVAALAAQWLATGLCRRSVFNLKLPMKKRYQEVKHCLEIIERRLRDAGVTYGYRCKQLYHDREEVTVYLYCV